jgi:hypothetical protein
MNIVNELLHSFKLESKIKSVLFKILSILRISLNAPSQAKTPTPKDNIATLTLNFHSRLPVAKGALFYKIGQY